MMTTVKDHQSTLSNLKESGRCIFCYQNDDEIGPLMVCDRFYAHFPCMAFNSRLSQYYMPEGSANVDLLGGFHTGEVLAAFIANRRISCATCNVAIRKIKSSDRREADELKKWTNPALFTVKGASAGCSLRQCRKSFHYPCAPIKKHYTKHKIDFYRVYCSEEHLERGKQFLKTEVKKMFVDKPSDSTNVEVDGRDGEPQMGVGRAEEDDGEGGENEGENHEDDNEDVEDEDTFDDDGNKTRIEYDGDDQPRFDSIAENDPTLAPNSARQLKASSLREELETTKRRSGRLCISDSVVAAEVKRERTDDVYGALSTSTTDDVNGALTLETDDLNGALTDEADDLNGALTMETTDDVNGALTVETEPVLENLASKRKKGMRRTDKNDDEDAPSSKRRKCHDGNNAGMEYAIKQEFPIDARNTEEFSPADDEDNHVEDNASVGAFGPGMASSADAATTYSMYDDPLEERSTADSAIASLSPSIRSKHSNDGEVESTNLEDRGKLDRTGEATDDDEEEVGDENDDEGVFFCRIERTMENQKNRSLEVALESIGLEFFIDEDSESDPKAPPSYSSPRFVSSSIRWPHCLPRNLRRKLPSRLRKYFLLEMLDNLVRFPSLFDAGKFLRHVFLNLSRETIEEWRGIDEIERKLAEGERTTESEEAETKPGKRKRGDPVAEASSSYVTSTLDAAYRRVILARVSSLCRRRDDDVVAELTPSGNSFILKIGAALDPSIEMRRRLVLVPDVEDVRVLAKEGQEEQEEEEQSEESAQESYKEEDRVRNENFDEKVDSDEEGSEEEVEKDKTIEYAEETHMMNDEKASEEEEGESIGVEEETEEGEVACKDGEDAVEEQASEEEAAKRDIEWKEEESAEEEKRREAVEESDQAAEEEEGEEEGDEGKIEETTKESNVERRTDGSINDYENSVFDRERQSLSDRSFLLAVFSESDYLLNYLYLSTGGFRGVSLRVLDVGSDNPLGARSSHGAGNANEALTALNRIVAGIQRERIPCSAVEDVTDITVVMPVNPNIVSEDDYCFAAIREAFERGRQSLRRREGEEGEEEEREEEAAVALTKTAFVVTPTANRRDFLKTLSEFVVTHEDEFEVKIVSSPYRDNRVRMFQLNFF